MFILVQNRLQKFFKFLCVQAEGGPIQYPDGTVPQSAYGNPPSPLPANVVQPTIGKLIAFMSVIYFIGEHPVFFLF
jgi:hypothetical protein